MKSYFGLILCFIIFSCNNQRSVLLPEIQSATTIEVLDVSAAYIFYDETQEDSTLLNRKNLISTTNWLVNVDKRLSLRQVIPHINFLLNKKRNAKMHKNENAKNYFTCNNLETNTLGFIEFTKVNYKKENPDFIESSKNNPDDYIILKIKEDKTTTLIKVVQDIKTEIAEGPFLNNLTEFKSELLAAEEDEIILFFDEDLSFQDYIDVKHFFSLPANNQFKVSENEYLFP